MSLDLEAVARWMAGQGIDIQVPLSAEKFSGGQSNPTYLLKSAHKAWVLRRKPAGALLKSAHAVEREFRVQCALAGSDVPVAPMIALCEDAGVIGSAFYLMDHVSGRCFDDPRLLDVLMGERASYINEMGRVLAAIHKIDLTATGLSDYGPRGNYYRRQIDRWSQQYRASETGVILAMDGLMAALDVACPQDDGRATLVHGDYRIDNLLFAPDAPRIAAVLDWELSTIGHPFADLAAVIMQWQMPPGDQGRGLRGVGRAALGLPSDEVVVAAYCDRMGLARIDNFGFYVGFCFFRMAAILQGVKKRALDGTASDPERGLRLGALVPDYAAAGLEALG
ncbi:phosphotransferase family protein [Roseicyclus mahoneyensis]|uniref:Aminoglycoside phosphotransferase (APT) family kinase protein n=1 Tax=Roseicyclus mahoneyensis TaxID=164332 RepID=A0A316GIZ4_9RHOB|nr:phosphotransferase family protein [Roseicyclus mahoneyensis]PWK60565.1 aminoglycoside phosphotransferase (APT) family kinase protein [Roseicyclus mahoneyensis]